MVTWLEDIEKTLTELRGTGTYPEIYIKIKEIRKGSFSKTWKATVRQTIERHSSDSDNFAGNDIFFSVEGIGNGVWGLRKYFNKSR